MRLLLLLSLAACSRAAPAPLDEPAIPDVPGMRPELTYFVRHGDGARFGGFDGALSDPIEVEGRTVTPDEHGRFELDLPAAKTLQVGPLTYRLREPDTARAEAVRAPLTGAGNTPNDLVIAEASEPYGVLVRSGDDGVSVVDLQAGLDMGARVDGNPYTVAVLDADARRVAVTDTELDRVLIVDLDAKVVEAELSPPAPIALDPPFELSRPFDVDGDGTEETSIVELTPVTPQSIAVVGDRLLVGYGSILEHGRGDRAAVVLPGVVAVWSLDALDAAPAAHLLPALNPQEIRPWGEGALIVCSGLISGEDHSALTDGALVLFGESVEMTISMGKFRPGSAAPIAGRLVVSSLVEGRLLSMDQEGNDPVPVRINDEPVDSLFRIVDLGGGLAAVPSFNTDRLHVFDVRTGEVDPPPFYAPLEVTPGRPVLDGLQIVARRPGRRGVDFIGPDLFALNGLSSEVVPIELRKILGP